jgi:hypothetical protein
MVKQFANEPSESEDASVSCTNSPMPKLTSPKILSGPIGERIDDLPSAAKKSNSGQTKLNVPNSGRKL